MAGKLTLVAALLAVHLCSAFKYDPMQNRLEKDTELDWWESTVFYQIYPRSFMDSDGDGIGDLKGIISKLDHLSDAGIGATWLSPIMKSPMADFGYDISDFYDIDPIFGNMADFDALMVKAKSLGIKIIMDLVPNHSSDECKWFLESINKTNGKDDFYIWQDPIYVGNSTTPSPPNNWVSVFRGSAWEYNPIRKQYYLHQFAKQQPDLNYRNPKVVEQMQDVIKFWLDKGIGGFRIDAINHQFEIDRVNKTFPDEPRNPDNNDKDDYGYVDHIYTKDLDETYWGVYEWRTIFDSFYDKLNETRIMMTEAYTDINKTMLYYGNATSTGSHIPFNFGLINEADESSTAGEIENVITKWLSNMPAGKTANWVIGNHDQWRVATRYGMERVDGLNMMVMLLPGAAVTYNGEEIGMSNTNITWEDTKDPQACNTDDPVNYWKSSRDPARTPFQWDNSTFAGFSTTKNNTWLPVNPNYKEINLKFQKEANRSHYKIYKNLVSMRKIYAFSHGKLETKAISDQVFSFTRSVEGNETYVVVINLSATKQVVALPFEGLSDTLTVMETSIQSTKEISSEVTTGALDLTPYEALVLKSGAAKFTAGIVLLMAALFVKLL